MSSKGATSMPWRDRTQRIIFEVLRDLEHRGVFQQRLQPVERLADRNLALREPSAEKVVAAATMAERNVAGLARRDAPG